MGPTSDDLMLSGDEGQIQIGNEGGFAGGLALGKIQGKNLRSELEVTYRGNDLTSMTLNNLAGSTQLLEGDGRIDTVSGMLNVIWDFTDFPTQRFKPYLGAGFGGISANADFQIDGQSTLVSISRRGLSRTFSSNTVISLPTRYTLTPLCRPVHLSTATENWNTEPVTFCSAFE